MTSVHPSPGSGCVLALGTLQDDFFREANGAKCPCLVPLELLVALHTIDQGVFWEKLSRWGSVARLCPDSSPP